MPRCLLRLSFEEFIYSIFLDLILDLSAPHRTLRQLPSDQGTAGAADAWSLKRPRSYPQRAFGKDRDDSEAHSLLDTQSQAEMARGEVTGTLNRSSETTALRGAGSDASPLTPPSWGQGVAVMPMEQRGVLRTNCIDCLDRTNVGQFSIGVHVLAKQLYVMGVSNQESLDSGSQVR